MKIYRKGATIVIDKGVSPKIYFPTLDGKFYFEDKITIIEDKFTNTLHFLETILIQNEAGTLIGNEAAVETYLAEFVGQSFNTSVTDSIDVLAQNLSDHEANHINPHGDYLRNTFIPTLAQTIFTLSTSSISGYYFLTVNGLIQTVNVDYTISGTTLTWLNVDFSLSITDILIFYYKN